MNASRVSSAARRTLAAIGVATVAVLGLIALLDRATVPVAPLPPDTVVVVDGVAHVRSEFDAFRESTRPFSSHSAAERELRIFGEHLVLVRESEARSSDAKREPAANDVPIPTVTEEDVEAYYAANRSRFVRPRTVRVAYFRIARSDDPARDEQRIRALYVRAQMAQSERAFQALLAEEHDGLSAGELDPFPCGEAHPVLSERLVREACALPLGALGTPIEQAGAFFLLRKLGDFPAVNRPLARVRREIRTELEASAQNAADEARRRALIERAEIVIPHDAFDALVSLPEATPAPTGPPRAPGWS